MIDIEMKMSCSECGTNELRDNIPVIIKTNGEIFIDLHNNENLVEFSSTIDFVCRDCLGELIEGQPLSGCSCYADPRGIDSLKQKNPKDRLYDSRALYNPSGK